MQTFDVRIELGGTTSMRVGLLADLAFLSPSVDDVSDNGPTAMRLRVRAASAMEARAYAIQRVKSAGRLMDSLVVDSVEVLELQPT